MAGSIALQSWHVLAKTAGRMRFTHDHATILPNRSRFMLEIDPFDRKLLGALQEDARLTNVQLAERVGLSASPCLRRVKRLEAEGAIAAYRAILDRQKIGLGLTVFVGVKV